VKPEDKEEPVRRSNSERFPRSQTLAYCSWNASDHWGQ